MVTPTDRQGEYRAICLFEGWKMEGRDMHISKLACYHNRSQRVLQATPLLQSRLQLQSHQPTFLARPDVTSWLIRTG